MQDERFHRTSRIMPATWQWFQMDDCSQFSNRIVTLSSQCTKFLLGLVTVAFYLFYLSICSACVRFNCNRRVTNFSIMTIMMEMQSAMFLRDSVLKNRHRKTLGEQCVQLRIFSALRSLEPSLIDWMWICGYSQGGICRGKPGNFPLTGSDLPSHWFV